MWFIAAALLLFHVTFGAIMWAHSCGLAPGPRRSNRIITALACVGPALLLWCSHH